MKILALVLAATTFAGLQPSDADQFDTANQLKVQAQKARAPKTVFIMDGRKGREVTTTSSVVKQVVSREDIELEGKDKIVSDLEAPVENGMMIVVQRTVKDRKTVSKKIRPKTIVRETPVECDLDQTSKVVQQPRPGVLKIRERVEKVDGKVVAKVVVDRKTVKRPRPKVIAECTPRKEPVVTTPTPEPAPSSTSTSAPSTSTSAPTEQPSRSTPDRPVSTTVTGSKEDWLRAAGIPEDQWHYVDYIVSRESSWNPKAVNPSSGACGLAQALPCSKMGPNWDDPVVALKWQYAYVSERHGGYAGAYSFWRANKWY